MESQQPTQIDQIWLDALSDFNLKDIQLIAESRCDPFRRTYALGRSTVLKIVLGDHEISGGLRRCTPEEEFRILERLGNVGVTPRPLEFREQNGVSVLRMERRSGTQLETLQAPPPGTW